MFNEKGVLKNFAKFTGKHLCRSLAFIKLQAPTKTLLKKGFRHRSFLVNFVKFLKKTFFRRTPLYDQGSFYLFKLPWYDCVWDVLKILRTYWAVDPERCFLCLSKSEIFYNTSERLLPPKWHQFKIRYLD